MEKVEKDPDIVVITHLLTDNEDEEPHVEKVVNLEAGLHRAKVIIHEGLQIISDPYTFQFYPPDSVVLVEVRVIVPEGETEEKGKAN